MCIPITPGIKQTKKRTYNRQLPWFGHMESKIESAVVHNSIKALLSNILHSAGMLCIEFLYDDHNQDLCSHGNLLRKHEKNIPEVDQKNLLKLFSGFLLCKYFHDEAIVNSIEHPIVEQALFDLYDFNETDIQNYNMVKCTFQTNRREMQYCLLSRKLMSDRSFNSKNFVDLIQLYTHTVYHEVLLQM